ncbi:type VI secretion system-associated FHA domain protein TagH [Achromobacter mucicolens]|uniref:type VI secretion system-associated FHA domain protein TagH n=1 Tax=Achromobacter mucicolens TaxID=1389922 RepID=UPI000D464FC6|nr:type VI secretion system-associated FHA domain protein TagH [Achromobacter mucicolens]PTW88917.1 type VI secretion system-associated FHA domain protein TagH [Achromobacter mucicolens]
MNPTSSHHRLALVVDNPQALQKGSQPRCIFDTSGGTIGAHGADWILHDRSGRVQSIHCEVRYEDGGYFVIDRCGQTRVNDQMDPLGALVSVQLRGGDILHVGPYRLTVNLDDETYALPDPARHLAEHDVAELLGTSNEHVEALPHGDEAPAPSQPPELGWREFTALSESSAQGQLDPLLALDAASRPDPVSAGNAASLDSRHYGQTQLAAQADLSTTRFEAVSGSPLHAFGDPPMSGHPSSFAAHRSSDQWIQNQFNHSGDAAGLVAPLVEGLGAPVGAVDPHDAHTLLFEAGTTLAALIRGLAALNRAPQGERLALAKRTLQPIEDNPLRLAQTYPDTVRALFSRDRSLVHLSPTAAVEESLEQIGEQHRAMLKAVAAGLSALLQAFSPDQLERRFARYRSGQHHEALPGDGAWQMYRHYYDELKSSRQQGFDKLFWEVFDQAYDQALRKEEP